MSMRVTRSVGFTLISLLAAAACGGADIGSDASFQRDSFSSPTEHGELVFTDGARNQAQFGENTRFHSWTFTLAGDADVVLKTDPTTVNLDTVLYLYRRDPGERLWGRYIAQNDNHGDEMFSLIDKHLRKGEYRIKVKATHPRMVGDFNVEASCNGPGCPAEERGVCEPTHGAGAYTEGCGARVRDVMMAPVTSESHTTITWGNHCDQPNLIAQGATAYRDYYGDWFDWDDYVGEDGEMYVMLRKHGDAGAVVSIDLGGDEDNVSFLFDAGGKLLVTFHSEQSSTTWYSCGAENEAAASAPDHEECGQALLYSLAHSNAATSNGTTTVQAAEGDLDAFVAAGIRHYASHQALGDDDTIDYTLSQWSEGAELQLSHGGGDVSTLVLADRWGDTVLAMSDLDGVTELKCTALE